MAPTVGWCFSFFLFQGGYLEDRASGRNGYVVNKPMVMLVSPLTGVVGPLPNDLFMAYKWGWSYLLTNWDDPPSNVLVKDMSQDLGVTSKRYGKFLEEGFKNFLTLDLQEIDRHGFVFKIKHLTLTLPTSWWEKNKQIYLKVKIDGTDTKR